MPIPTDSSSPSAPLAAPAPQAPAAGPAEFDPAAGIAAIVFPGAGHMARGEVVRGVLIAAGILGLFLGGLLIGGVCVIDRRDNPIWFAGQALVGPLAFGVDYYADQKLKVTDSYTGTRRTIHPDEMRDPDGRARPLPPGALPAATQSLGRMNELGTLFTTIAGMLNLIVIIDAAFHSRRPA